MYPDYGANYELARIVDAFRRELPQGVDRKDDIRIGVGLGVVVVMMGDPEARRFGAALDDPVADVARIDNRKGLLAGAVNAGRAHE